MSFNFEEERQQPMTQQKPAKFGKSSSLSSVKTASEGYLEQETLCRKIAITQKERFIELITEDNYNMKEAAKQVNISYSTAKKIYSRFKKQLKNRLVRPISTSTSTLRCGYVDRDGEQSGELEERRAVMLICTIAGRQQPAFGRKSSNQE